MTPKVEKEEPKKVESTSTKDAKETVKEPKEVKDADTLTFEGTKTELKI